LFGAGTGPAFAQGMIDQLLAHENYGLAKQLLDAAALRHDALAANLANLETPGYKRVDLAPDFAQQLASLSSRSDSESLPQLQPKIVEDRSARAMRPDGNNVQLDKELVEMNRNSVEYEFLTQYASDSLRRLRTAISGRTA
jgi:flagellar basal-body rod protein FlgB